MIAGIHHIAIIVRSESTVDFYRRLGFAEYLRKDRQYDTVVLLRGYGIELELFVDPGHPFRATAPENLGLRHIAFKVNRIEDTVKEYNLTIGPIATDWGGIRYANTQDPDGNPIELHE